MKTCDVRIDRAGVGHLRLTCYSCGTTSLHDITCLRQPYMNDEQWGEKLEAFKAAHPSDATKDITKWSK